MSALYHGVPRYPGSTTDNRVIDAPCTMGMKTGSITNAHELHNIAAAGRFDLNRAAYPFIDHPIPESAPDNLAPMFRKPMGVFQLFVGHLEWRSTAADLMSIFSAYPSCISAIVLKDKHTGQSRRCGFVRFSDKRDRQRALEEKQGAYCRRLRMNISVATDAPRSHEHIKPLEQVSGATHTVTDLTHTTVHINGLASYVTAEELCRYFQSFGMVSRVEIYPDQCSGFVQYVHDRQPPSGRVPNRSWSQVHHVRL